MMARKREFPKGVGFSLCLVGSSFLGLIYPDFLLGREWFDGQFISNFATICIFFFIGRAINLTGLVDALKQPSTVLLIQSCIFLVPWVCAFGLMQFGFLQQVQVGWFFLLVLPTTVSSCIVYSKLAGGNGEFALTHSFLSNLLAPLLLPILFASFISSSVKFAWSIYPQIFIVILLPLLLGIGSRHFPFVWTKEPRKGEAMVPPFCILILSYLAFAQGSSGGMFQLGWDELIISLLVCWIGMSALAWLAGRVISKDKGIRVSAYFIISQKSLATGIPLAFAIISNVNDSHLASIIVPITAYHLFQLLMGSLLVAWMNSGKVKE